MEHAGEERDARCSWLLTRPLEAQVGKGFEIASTGKHRAELIFWENIWAKFHVVFVSLQLPLKGESQGRDGH